MDEPETPYASAVKWLEADVPLAEVVTRLKASGLNAEETRLLLVAAARKVNEAGKALEVDQTIVPPDLSERAKLAAQAEQARAAERAQRPLETPLFGIGLLVLGLTIFLASNGRIYAGGLVLVGIWRLLRRSDSWR